MGVLHLAAPMKEAKCISDCTVWVGRAEQLLHHIVSVWNMRIPEPGNGNAFSPDASFQLEKKNIFDLFFKFSSSF